MSLEIPEGAPPAEIALLLVGRPTIGAVGSTLVDLVARGVLGFGLELLGTADVRYEKALLGALDDLDSGLMRFREELIIAGVRRGWFHHGASVRTHNGEQALAAARRFRAALRHGEHPDLLPYAVALGTAAHEGSPLTVAVEPVLRRIREIPDWQPPEPEPVRYDRYLPNPAPPSRWV